MVRWVIAALLLPSGSWAFCLEPSQPRCISTFVPQYDNYDWTMDCAEQMSEYEAQVIHYRDCLETEISALRDQQNSAIEQFNRTNQHFICNLQRQSFCPGP